MLQDKQRHVRIVKKKKPVNPYALFFFVSREVPTITSFRICLHYQENIRMDRIERSAANSVYQLSTGLLVFDILVYLAADRKYGST